MNLGKQQAGLSAEMAAETARIGHDLFTFGFADAMRATMIMPVTLLAVGALSCLAIGRHHRAAQPGRAAEAPEAHWPPGTSDVVIDA